MAVNTVCFTQYINDHYETVRMTIRCKRLRLWETTKWALVYGHALTSSFVGQRFKDFFFLISNVNKSDKKQIQYINSEKKPKNII